MIYQPHFILSPAVLGILSLCVSYHPYTYLHVLQALVKRLALSLAHDIEEKTSVRRQFAPP